MSSCFSDEDLAVELDEGTLRPSVQEHIDTCPTCRRLVVGLAVARSSLEGTTLGGSVPKAMQALPLPRGTLVGRYLITGVVGAGAMGVVYAAYDPDLDRKVAIKFVHAAESSTAMQELLRKEAQAMARLTDPHVVTVHDVGVYEQRVYLTMELIDGESLAEWLASEPRSWRAVIDAYLAAGRGLASAHAAGVLHRDFKPANVLRARKDGRVVVGDFGLARTAPELAAEPHMIAGTPSFMAPEVLAGEDPTPGSDQFSFCVAVYQGLYGSHPFVAGNFDSVRSAPPGSRVPARIRQCLLRGLSREPARRFPSMSELVGALEAASAQRGRSMFVLAGVAAIAVVSIGAWWMARGSPVVPTVTVARRLTTEPGCEEYPHFLPDGRSVIFDGLFDGDYEIIRLDLETGVQRPLTRDPGWDYGSSVSPDGTLATYIHQGQARELRVVATDGSTRPRSLGLIAVGYPSWTADGAILVGEEGGRIRRIGLDGSSEQLPMTLPHGTRVQLLLEVGDRGIATVALRSNNIPTMWLSEIGRESGTRMIDEPLIDDEAGMALAPAGDSYYVTTSGPAGSTQLVRRRWGGEAVPVPGGLPAHAGIDVSRDGTQLVYSTCSGRNHLMLIPREGAPSALPRGEWGDMDPRRVDDHRFLVTSGRGGPQQVWLVDERSDARVLAGPQTSSGVPSPTADLVVYVDSAQRGIFTVPMHGGLPSRLTSDPTDASPAFTRDGTYILFERSAPGEAARIWRVPTRGGTAEPLGPRGTVQPVASPTDDLIIAVDYTRTSPQLVALEDGHVRDLGLSGTRPRFSPDGRRVLATQEEIRVVEWTLDGAAPPRTVWQATTEAVVSADYLDADRIVASVSEYRGDLWLARGEFP